MKIWMIWAEDESDSHKWLIDAWDDDGVVENPEGWEEAKKKAYKAHGPESVRILTTDVDMDKVNKAFHPMDVGL